VTSKPYCPTCNRRLHKLTAKPARCLVCKKPVESLGFGRPRKLHPECRNVRRKVYRRKARSAEVAP